MDESLNQDQNLNEPIIEQPGPITDAYLQRDVHPDDVPGTKPGHQGPYQLGGNPLADLDEQDHTDFWCYS
ncbi:MAG TPA: hypothetical protein VGB97_02440 [Candidatus Paceibacterota bacterium]|jgi:hypothetical protein